jgi:acetyltransferase-like isoleucine patch superfamily enzyme
MVFLKTLTHLLKNVRHPATSIFTLTDSSSIIHEKAKINRFTRFLNSSIGKYSYIGPNSRIESSDIGAFCSISWDCQIGLNSHSLSHISTSPIFLESKNGTGTSWIASDINIPFKRRTRIGNDVWIGARATILAGIQVGDGAVIGTAAVVTKDVPAYSIAAGNPARVIRERFDESIVNRLKELRWWELEDTKLRVALASFQAPHPTIKTLEELESIKIQS